MRSARLLFCWVLIGLIPGSLLGADSGAAMLYAKGTAWINGSTVPRSSAVFPGDLVQTRPDAVVHQCHGFERNDPVGFAGEV